MTSRAWDVVINNYTWEEFTRIQSYIMDMCVYGVIGEEVGACGTPHLQCAFSSRESPFRVGHVTELFRCSARPVRNWNKCIDYCKKDGKWWEWGDSKQGQRTDLSDAHDAIRGGATTAEMWKDHAAAMTRYHTGLEKMMAVVQEAPTIPLYTEWRWPPITDWTKTHILVGDSGCGKTCYALMHFPAGALLVSHIDDLKRFDPKRHEGIVFDDIMFAHMPETTQIHIVDQDLPRSIHIRYSTASIPAHTKKIFTCNPGRMPVNINDPAINRRIFVTEVSRGNNTPSAFSTHSPAAL